MLRTIQRPVASRDIDAGTSIPVRRPRTRARRWFENTITASLTPVTHDWLYDQRRAEMQGRER